MEEVLVTKGWEVIWVMEMFNLIVEVVSWLNLSNFAELYTKGGIFYCMKIIPFLMEKKRIGKW